MVKQATQAMSKRTSLVTIRRRVLARGCYDQVSGCLFKHRHNSSYAMVPDTTCQVATSEVYKLFYNTCLQVCDRTEIVEWSVSDQIHLENLLVGYNILFDKGVWLSMRSVTMDTLKL